MGRTLRVDGTAHQRRKNNVWNKTNLLLLLSLSPLVLRLFSTSLLLGNLRSPCEPKTGRISLALLICDLYSLPNWERPTVGPRFKPFLWGKKIAYVANLSMTFESASPRNPLAWRGQVVTVRIIKIADVHKIFWKFAKGDDFRSIWGRFWLGFLKFFQFQVYRFNIGVEKW